MNVRELADRLDMKEEEFSEWAELFVETSTADLDRMAEAVKAGARLEAADAAHSIKGAAANLGLADFSELAKKIENEARGGCLDRAAESVLSLRSLLDRTAETLGKRSKTK